MKKIKPIAKRNRFRRWLRKLFGRRPRPSELFRADIGQAFDEMHEHLDPTIADAIKSGKTKKCSITLGVEVKRCSECERRDCHECVYKGEFERLMNLPNCHDCGLSTGNSCGHRPKLGEDIRINCPLWQPKKHDGYRIDHVIYDDIEREGENDAT